MLLDILQVDFGCFGPIVRAHLDVGAIEDLTGAGDYRRHEGLTQIVKVRMRNFKQTKRMLEKAEDMKKITKYLSSLHTARYTAGPRKDRHGIDKAVRRLSHIGDFFENACRRIEKRYDEQLSVYSSVSQLRQSTSVTALTILAAIFLPLSLSAGILSMSSRLSDVGVKLYDFFGLTCFFLSFALFVYLCTLIAVKDHDRGWELRIRQFNKWMRMWVRVAMWPVRVVFGIGWCLIIASFAVGMFEDGRVPHRGLKILYAGLAICVVSPLAMYVSAFVVICFRVGLEWLLRRLRDKPKQETSNKNEKTDSRDRRASV
jgi:hypothetical protein